MAGETRHLALTFEVVAIDRHLHLDHLARGLLRLLVVLLKRAAHVAEIALHPQRIGNELHRRNYFVRRRALERLNILEYLFGRIRAVLWRWPCRPLCPDRTSCKEDNGNSEMKRGPVHVISFDGF